MCTKDRLLHALQSKSEGCARRTLKDAFVEGSFHAIHEIQAGGFKCLFARGYTGCILNGMLYSNLGSRLAHAAAKCRGMGVGL